ncbi:protein kinase domain-containing protein [Anabaena sp. FACHB-709]|uniref:non-specific serine/threonine protein kinase n=2 Tax=Nostocaceae TaxID=1162 RepID=A0A1Z4KN85_ANAVA|nr:MULTISPECIES: serine/threonine protein kinase [Nostocaceae]BAY70419.1 serine/threonine kinase [Trichormus variabilis NIES-23]HBW28980.1 serine/threonine protein kinase [Nostoc sp. UBA8866]MBD2174354.1 protein kinase [Anabaena cylindrica FACHB-318]MBD2266072.1 protein kinase [Anabaena sp. FACHB-709]MBD2275446.1 protein kinase [Nostoc sp. PCC 7120 = FACHB-418]
MIGKLLDHRYQVIRVLAIGGFGQTYIAQDTRRPGNPTCVVKHLKPATSDPRVFETAKRLFNSEAETLENLGHHDQIPRLLAYFDENQEFYLVQEFIDGHTLTEELIPGNRWSEGQVTHLLQEILCILEFVHHQGVIHRDIKPDNIIRRTADNKLVLVDFGAVKQLRTQLVTVGGQSSATVAIGTPGYMPTEQGQGKPRPNSDIYALGIIAIQALTGILPTQLQEDPQTGELIWRHLVNVSDRLAVVLNKMVRYHFKDRYQTASEALQALQNALNPVVAVSSTSAKSLKNSYYQSANPSSPVSRQQTVAVAPTNPVVTKPGRKDSHNSDPLPLLIGIVLAGGAAALVANFYPNVKNFAANVLSNNATSGNKCLAVVAGNSNIRSEPSSINTDTVLQTIGVNTNFEVTGKRTKRGWVEIKFNSSRLAWAHSDVIINDQQWTSCLRDKGIALKTVDDSTLIAARPVPKPQPKLDSFINSAPEPEASPNSQPTEAAQPKEDTTKVVAQARKKYESGDLVGAIAMLRSIPANASAGIKETSAMINQWQQDWQKADALFNDINKALENGQWDKVLEYKNQPEKLPNIKYWQDKLEPVFKQATENVAKQALPKTENPGEPNNDMEESRNYEEESINETPSSEEPPQGGY